MAPELVKNKTHDSKVDIWALGVLTYMIMTGNKPFDGNNSSEVFSAIRMNKVNYERLQKYHMKGQLVRSFLIECFATKPSARPSADELLEHPWIKTMVKEELVERE